VGIQNTGVLMTCTGVAINWGPVYRMDHMTDIAIFIFWRDKVNLKSSWSTPWRNMGEWRYGCTHS